MKRAIALVSGSLGLFACGSTTNAVRYDAHVAGTNSEHMTRIEIEERVTDECHLPQGTTYFAYDSAEIDKMDDAAMAQVAHCMINGPLRKESIIVIGYADARGTTAYNKDLGLTRAETIADALFAHGVPKSRLFVKSFGENRASDKQTESDWARDRKVTLRVAEPE